MTQHICNFFPLARCFLYHDSDNLWPLFTCGGSSQVYKCPVFFSSQRMDVLVSSANISFSVKLAHPAQLVHPAQWAHQISRIFGYHKYPRAQLAHPAQPAICPSCPTSPYYHYIIMSIRFHGYLDITDICNLLISWVSDFTDIWIPWIS